MFCRNCGCKNDDEAVFCRECGSKLNVDINGQEKSSYTATSMQQQGTISLLDIVRKIPRKLLIGISAAVVLIIVIVVIAINMSSTINLDKYVDVTINGYDGYGRANVEIDWDAIEKKYGSKIAYTNKAKSEYGNSLAYISPMEFMTEYVSINLEKTTGLKNNDTISYTWNIDEEELSSYLKCKIKFKDDTVLVSGLSEIDTFDPFDDLDVTFNGVDPSGSMSIEYTGDILSSYDFYCDNTYDLKNGDEIVVYLNINDAEYYADNYGKIPSRTEKGYTVTGLGKYVTTLAEIDSITRDSMKTKSKEVIDEYTSTWSLDATVDAVNYVGCYLQVAKDNSAYNHNIYGDVYEIVSRVQASEDKESVSVIEYYDVQFSNIIANDSNCEVDLELYSTPYESFSKKAFYGDYSFSYNNYYYDGFESLAALKKVHVDNYEDEYESEWDIEDEEKYNLSNESADRLCEYSSDREITEQDIAEYLASDYTAYAFPGERNIIQMIINEMYALKGYQFSDEELQSYFEQKEWYTSIENKTDDMDAIYANMSTIEQENINLLEQYK